MLNPFTHRKVLEHGAPGRATVVSVGALDRDGTIFNLPMTLQVFVEGMTPYEVEDQWWVNHKDVIGLSGWIPVRVDPEERDKVAIDWDGVRERHEQAKAARREALAEGGLSAGADVQIQEIDLSTDPEAAQQVMQMLGQMGLGVPGATAPPPAGGATSPDDTIGRLERLAALRASGVLTEQEFQEQKRRILGGQ